MHRLKNKNIYYIPSGAPKARYAKQIIQELIKESANVFTIPTQNSLAFFNLNDVKKIKNNIVKLSWDKNLKLPKEDAILIAPCTFNTLNNIAAGYANSYPLCLIASAIGNQIPVFIAPAMNKSLWSHPIIPETIKKLENWNCRVIWPEITKDKVAMIDVGKILDTLYFHFCRINFISKKIKTQIKLNKLQLFRNRYFKDFYEIGEFLKKHNLNLPTAGCLSIKIDDGFIITSSGSDLSYLKDNEISLITSWDERKNKIEWVGDKTPSSESPLHCIVHQQNKDKFVLHIHSPKMTYSDKLFKYRSKKYFRYGTFNIGYEAQKLLGKNKFCILKAHGEIVISNTLSEIKQILLKFNKFI